MSYYEPEDLTEEQEQAEYNGKMLRQYIDWIEKREMKYHRMMHFTVKCSACSWETTEDYTRQNPDRLVFLQCCPKCQHPLQLVSAIPYDTRETESSQPERECWECGDARGQLHTYQFGNGVEIKICNKHFKRYAKWAYKMATTPRPTPQEIRASMADLEPLNLEWDLL